MVADTHVRLRVETRYKSKEKRLVWSIFHRFEQLQAWIRRSSLRCFLFVLVSARMEKTNRPYKKPSLHQRPAGTRSSTTDVTRHASSAHPSLIPSCIPLSRSPIHSALSPPPHAALLAPAPALLARPFRLRLEHMVHLLLDPVLPVRRVLLRALVETVCRCVYVILMWRDQHSTATQEEAGWASPRHPSVHHPSLSHSHEGGQVVEVVDVVEEVLDVVRDVLHVLVHRAELVLVHLRHGCRQFR